MSDPVLNDASAPVPDHRPGPFGRLLRAYQSVPLYLRIVVALAAGIALGLALGHRAESLKVVSKIILRFLGALAPALILVAVIDAIMNADNKGTSAGRRLYLLVLNTLVAILIGLFVANLIRPGKGFSSADKPDRAPPDASKVGEQILDQLPRSVVEPLVTNNVIGVVILAVAFGVAFRRVANAHDVGTVRDFVKLAFKAIVVILHWIIDLVPIAVLCTVAAEVGTRGFGIFAKLAWFILAVLLALALQTAWYLTRIRLGSWVRPGPLLGHMRDALTMAFSTSSSTATMPVTYAALRERVGLREDSASMGALVGSNFNNDGTALYEAMAALFIAQAIGYDLTFTQQAIVVVMAVIASVGAAGIPEAGLVTMTLVFTAVGLPPDKIFWLLPVDWFLDRCRTMINVLGDVNVACLLEGHERTSSPGHGFPVIVAPAEPTAASST
jgi:DAACS family dicarboxylate/amino acid:cation (Na+ or H+) symporter